MRNRSIHALTLLGLLGLLAGCQTGPTQAGKLAREAAQDRMNLINAQISYDQARQLYETGQFEKAQRQIRVAISRYDKSADFFLLQGRIFLETNQLEKSLESLKTASEKKEKFAEAYYFAGIVYQRWSDDEQAYSNYAKAYEIEPDKAQYLLAAAESLIALGELDAATELIAPKLNYFEHNSAIKQLQGQIALLKGDAKAAAAMYAEARMLDPDNNLLLEDLMWAQYAAGMYGQCHETAKRLQERSKEERFDVMHLEARCLARMNRGVEARELYIKLSKMRPADVSVWSEAGTLAWDLGDYRRLAMCSVQLIALAPQRYEGYMFKGINERHNGNLAESIGLFREASSLAPEYALPHLLLGQALEQSGDASGAKLAYSQALQADPSSEDAQKLLHGVSAAQAVTVAPTE